MNRKYANTIWALIAIFAFMGGLSAGVYYHNELMVWARSLGLAAPVEYASSTPPPVDTEKQSLITLPDFEEPLPIIYSDTLEEAQIQEYLKQGAVVLPLGTSFGEKGNVVVTAHSSGTEAFGPYRFAFAKLSELHDGQEYVISTPTAAYTYKVYKQEVVWPHQVDKLPNDDRATVTLVTCWPLWTNFKRLLVHSELVKTEYKL